jgi:hypothetical protein
MQPETLKKVTISSTSAATASVFVSPAGSKT